MRLSQHFRQKWRDFMGWEPTTGEIMDMLKRSHRVQEFAVLMRHDGSPHKVLAIYYDPETGVLLKVDEASRTIVTAFLPARRGRIAA